MNKKVLISILVVVVGISAIGLTYFLLRANQPKEYLLTVSNGAIYRISADGKEIKELGESMNGEVQIYSFSPDGKKILFNYRPNKFQATSLWIMDSDGNNKKKIAGGTNTEVYEARFSPDGNKIYFATEENKPESAHSSWYLWVENIDGTGKKNITEDMNKNSIYFSISPDGSKIAFVVASSSDEGSLWIMNPDGTDKKNLMVETRGIWMSDSSFSPTGKKILLYNSSVWIVNLDGRRKIDLDKATGMDFSPGYTMWFPQKLE